MFNQTMNNVSQSSIHRSHSSKCRAAPPPPPPPPSSSSSQHLGPSISSGSSTTLPETFVSSLRQLFSILDKTNVGYVHFDVFQRYWTPSFQLDNSSSSPSSRLDILHELEIESKAKNYLISFDLLLNVIERSLTTTKHVSPSSSSSSSSSSVTPPIVVPKVTRPTVVEQEFPLNRSTSVVVVPVQTKKLVDPRETVPIVYRSYQSGIDQNANVVRQRKKHLLQQKPTKFNQTNIYSENPNSFVRRNSIHSNEIDFAMVKSFFFFLSFSFSFSSFSFDLILDSSNETIRNRT